jgi:hypothetical protein
MSMYRRASIDFNSDNVPGSVFKNEVHFLTCLGTKVKHLGFDGDALKKGIRWGRPSMGTPLRN